MVRNSLSRSDRSLYWIACVVIACHLAVVVLGVLSFQETTPQRLVQKLVVKTVSLGERRDVAVIVEEPPPPPPPQEQEEVAAPQEPVEEEPEVVTPEVIAPKEAPALPPPKKSPEKKPVVKKKTKPSAPKKAAPTPKKKASVKPQQKPTPTAKKSPVKSEVAKARKQKLLANAQKTIAEMESSHATVSSKSPQQLPDKLPAAIETLQVDAFPSGEIENLTFQEVSYYDELASRLKLRLRLPEYGEVNIKLTLERSGRFVSVTITGARSAKNRQHVEKILPTLNYPSFGQNFKGAAQYTFLITLSNDL
jgi:colicin import membrane protein